MIQSLRPHLVQVILYPLQNGLRNFEPYGLPLLLHIRLMVLGMGQRLVVGIE